MSLISSPHTAAQNNILFTLMLADTAAIHSHRLSEWCGHGPVLEQDIALTNVALDHLGQARSLYQYAAECCNAMSQAEVNGLFIGDMHIAKKGQDNRGHTEDDLAYLRDAWDFKNVLLVEQPNTHFGYTVARCFFLDVYNFYFFQYLVSHSNKTWAAIAEKSLKEVTYHLKWSSEWMIRLGDGTQESHEKMQEAVNNLWSFTGELFQPTPYYDQITEGKLPDIKAAWDNKTDEIFTESTLVKPENNWMQQGGKIGQHSEHLGFILAEMQHMQRTYPGLDW